MSIESRIRAMVSAAAEGAFAFRPRLFDLSQPGEREALTELVEAGKVESAHDSIQDQLRELAAVRTPWKKMQRAELDELAAAHLGGRPVFEYGSWVYYPWSRSLIHALPRDEYRELRSSRNRYKITPAEQERLMRAKIGVVGLSVGLSSAVTLLLESIGGELRLADHDELALSNMNRLRTPAHNIGVNKSIIAAREMAEIDPYINVVVFERGLNEDNVEAFLTGGGDLDLVVEECDDLFMKIFVREGARAHGIPVIMETNERGMLDVERFDLEPDRPVLHGLLAGVRAAQVKGLTTRDKAPYVLRMIGIETISDRMRSSLLEIEQSVASWPQLASGVALGGAITTTAARTILLGQFKSSGRFFVDLDELVSDSTAAALSPDRALDEILRRDAMPELALPPLTRAGAGTSDDVAPEDIRAIVAHATLAPSAGNVQPWRFVAKGSTVRCLLDESRAWVFLDFNKLASYTALGAAVENMTLAASAMGLSPEVTPFPVPGDFTTVCDVRLSPGSGASSSPLSPEAAKLAPQIARRMTNRRRGSRSPLPRGVTDELHEAAARAGGRLLLLTEPAALDEAAALIGAIDRLMLLSERMHREYTGEIRWTQREAEATRDGVDIATVELEPVDLAGMRLAMAWPGMRLLRDIRGGRGLEKLAKDMIATSSAIGLVTMAGVGPESYFAGGRALERVWLTSAALDLALHPMSAIVYLFARFERGEGFSEPEIETLKGLRERYLKLFDVKAGEEAEILLFRLGYAGPATLRSLRRPVDDVLVFT